MQKWKSVLGDISIVLLITLVTYALANILGSLLMMAGANNEYVPGDAADVSLITADDPALVVKIHEICDRNNKELALMMGAAHGEHSHEHAH